MSGLTELLGRPRRLPRVPGSPTPGTVLAQVAGVSVRLGGTQILDDVDLTVRAGEVHALLGPNGAGKSTLLGVLSGDHAPTAGSVHLDGAPTSAWTTTELALRRAVLLQDVGLTFPFRVEDVVRMGRTPWRGTDAEEDDDDIVASALAATDVAHLAARLYPSLSGGERARCALARVLAQRAPVLLLDEPAAALDLKHQQTVLALARRHARAGGAVVLVVHDLNLAAAYADRITLLARGEVAGTGPPDSVLTEALLEDVYDHPVHVTRHPHTHALVVTPHLIDEGA